MWNRIRKRESWGLRRYRERPESEWIRVPAEHLRIITEGLWDAAHARLAASRASYLRGTRDVRWGRPPSGIASKYLLTGMATCDRCGGGMIVTSRDWKTRRKFAYACGYYTGRGSTVCANFLEAPMEATNREVLSGFQRDFLRPELVDESVRKALALLRPSDATDERRAALRAEFVRLDEELARLADAIASGGDVPALLAAIRDREERRRRLHAERASFDSLVRVSALDLRRLERSIRERFAEWHGFMAREPDHARVILGSVLVERFRFTPHTERPRRYYEFVGRWSIGRAIAGIIEAKGMVTPAGFEPAISTLKGSRPGPG